MDRPDTMNPRDTPSHRNASIYREAARIVAEGEHTEAVGGWSCLAVAKATDPLYTGNGGSRYDDYATVHQYEEVFPEIHGIGLMHPFERQNLRVLLLCMMAAITERP